MAKFQNDLRRKRSNLATPLYPILKNASLLSSTTFVSVPTLAMPINGSKMISSQSLSTVTKQILLGVTTTNIYTSPLKAMEELF
jgi:hypothetical protein